MSELKLTNVHEFQVLSSKYNIYGDYAIATLGDKKNLIFEVAYDDGAGARYYNLCQDEKCVANVLEYFEGCRSIAFWECAHVRKLSTENMYGVWMNETAQMGVRHLS